MCSHEGLITHLGLYTGFQDLGNSRSDIRDFKDYRVDFRNSRDSRILRIIVRRVLGQISRHPGRF